MRVVKHIDYGYGVEKAIVYGSSSVVDCFDGTTRYTSSWQLQDAKRPKGKVVALDWDGVCQTMDEKMGGLYNEWCKSRQGVAPFKSAEAACKYIQEHPNLSDEFWHSQVVTDGYWNTRPDSSLKNLISELHRLGYKVVIVTAREKHDYWCANQKEQSYRSSYGWMMKALTNDQICFDGIYFNVKQKGELCKFLQPDVFVDDFADNLNDVFAKTQGKTKCLGMLTAINGLKMKAKWKGLVVNSLQDVYEFIVNVERENARAEYIRESDKCTDAQIKYALQDMEANGVFDHVGVRLQAKAIEDRASRTNQRVDVQLTQKDLEYVDYQAEWLCKYPRNVLKAIRSLWLPRYDEEVDITYQVVEGVQRAVAIAEQIQSKAEEDITIVLPVDLKKLRDFDMELYKDYLRNMRNLMVVHPDIKLIVNDVKLAQDMKLKNIWYCNI